MSQRFKDHFSGHAADYAAHRPGYPGALYDWLAAVSPGTELAWDCATGNGQAAVELARRFKRVFASDASEAQLRHARSVDNVMYRVEPAERTTLNEHSVDLVTVAQAYHWFDHAVFVAECGRVCRPDGILAVWSYALAHVDAAVDAVIADFYTGPIGPYWPPERRLVESGYRELASPWPELAPPSFEMNLLWNLAQFENYLRTWSAVQRYRHECGFDPVTVLHDRLERAWGADTNRCRQVEWPIALRVFRVS